MKDRESLRLEGPALATSSGKAQVSREFFPVKFFFAVVAIALVFNFRHREKFQFLAAVRAGSDEQGCVLGSAAKPKIILFAAGFIHTGSLKIIMVTLLLLQHLNKSSDFRDRKSVV